VDEAMSATDAHPVGEGLAVLLVEDDGSIRSFLEGILQEKGFAVHSASDASAALRLVEESGCRVDLLVADMGLPRLSGANLAQQLRARDPRLPIILISGQPADPTDEAEGPSGPTVYLEKPFRPAQLLEAVMRLLRNRPDLTGKPEPGGP
jgi:two-component system cell cycle sensor histidine kinase/response regulator CckA